MRPPATDELRRILDDHRSTGSVYLPTVVDAAIRSASEEALVAELARRSDGAWEEADLSLAIIDRLGHVVETLWGRPR